jgi:hypothetical protein
MLFGGIVSCPLGWNEGAGTPLLALGPLALGPLAVFGRWESSRFLSTFSSCFLFLSFGTKVPSALARQSDFAFAYCKRIGLS